MPSRPRLRPPLARREQGVLKFLIVVEVVSLKEEPDHDARLERQGIPLEHDEFLRGPIAGDAEVGYGPTEASLQESGHDLIIRDVGPFDIGVADQDDVRPRERRHVAVTPRIVRDRDPISSGRGEAARDLDVASQPPGAPCVGRVPEPQIGIGYVVLLLSPEGLEDKLPVNEPDGGRHFQ